MQTTISLSQFPPEQSCSRAIREPLKDENRPKIVDVGVCRPCDNEVTQCIEERRGIIDRDRTRDDEVIREGVREESQLSAVGRLEGATGAARDFHGSRGA